MEQTTEILLLRKDLRELPSAQPGTHEERSERTCDCIERKAAIDALHGYFDGMLETDTWSPCDVYGLIEILPPAQPEIVRCKDCKYWMPHSQLGFDEDNGTYHDYCAKLVPEDEYYAFYRNADDYCSRAERRLDVDANT